MTGRSTLKDELKAQCKSMVEVWISRLQDGKTSHSEPVLNGWKVDAIKQDGSLNNPIGKWFGAGAEMTSRASAFGHLGRMYDPKEHKPIRGRPV